MRALSIVFAIGSAFIGVGEVLDGRWYVALIAFGLSITNVYLAWRESA